MNEWLPLQSIEKGKVGRGGLCEILAVPIEYISFFPIVDPVTQILVNSIQLLDGKYWFAYQLNHPSRAFKEESQVSAAGVSYNQTVSGRLVGQNTGNHLQLENMVHHRWVVLCRERVTGITYVIGKSWSGAILNIKYDSFTGTITEVLFSHQSKSRAFIYGGTATVVIPPPVTVPQNTFLIRMLIEFRIGDPGRAADGATSMIIPELLNKAKIAIFIDGQHISKQGYPDRLACTYTPSLNKIDTTLALAFKTLIQIYETT